MNTQASILQAQVEKRGAEIVLKRAVAQMILADAELVTRRPTGNPAPSAASSPAPRAAPPRGSN